MRNLARQVLLLTAKTSVKEDRKRCLVEAKERLEELQILIHLCAELKVFRSFKSFEFASRSVIEVAKQCEGWLKSQNP